MLQKSVYGPCMHGDRSMGWGMAGGRGCVYYNVYKTPCDGPLILSTLKRKEGKMAKAKA
jgi:hypothetical protein